MLSCLLIIDSDLLPNPTIVIDHITSSVHGQKADVTLPEGQPSRGSRSPMAARGQQQEDVTVSLVATTKQVRCRANIRELRAVGQQNEA